MGPQQDFCFFVFLLLPSTVLLNCMLKDTNQTLYDEITVKENTVANFSCELTASKSEPFADSGFLLELKVCDSKTNHSLCKCRWLMDKIDRCKTLVNFSSCENRSSEIHLSLLVKRTYSAIMWELFSQNTIPLMLKQTKLRVTYPPMIKSLLVNEGNLNETRVINELEQVEINCSFSNGNPPVNVELQVQAEGGLIKNVSRAAQEDLLLSFGDLHCQNVWPTVRCKAPGSEQNRSVSVLIRCPPQFAKVATEAFDLSRIRDEGLKIEGIRSHTATITKCWMINVSSKNEAKDMKCTFRGKAPHFIMIVHFGKESWIGEGNWTLFVSNGVGTSNMTFVFRNKVSNEQSRKSDSQDWNLILLIAVGCLLCAALSAAAVVFVCVGKPFKTRAPGNETNSHSADSSTVENEVQESTWSCTRNADSLIYGQLDFADRISSDVIIGSLPDTQYADINFTSTL